MSKDYTTSGRIEQAKTGQPKFKLWQKKFRNGKLYKLSRSKFLEITRPDRFLSPLFWAKTVDNQSNFGDYVTVQNLSGLKIGSTETIERKK